MHHYVRRKLKTLSALHLQSVLPDLVNSHIDGSVELSSYAALDAQHFAERVFVAVAHFKVVPRLPKGLGRPRIAVLRAVGIDGPRAVNFAQISLQGRKLQGERLHLKKNKSKSLRLSAGDSSSYRE